MAINIEGMPQCTFHRPRGHVQDFGTCGRQFHWQGLRGDTIQYVKTWPKCQMMKSDDRAKAGLVQPLEIPSKNLDSCNHGPHY